MARRTNITGGHFQDAAGNPLANGTITFELSAPSAQTVDGVFLTQNTIIIALDSNGDVVANSFIWGNDSITEPSFYRVTAYSSTGQPAWGPNNQTVVGTTFDLGTWIPNNLETFLTPSGSSPITSTTLTFVGPDNTPVANGTLSLTLSQDAVATDGSQVAAGRTVSCVLDSSGSCTFSIYPNNVLVPETVYRCEVTTQAGQPVWNQQCLFPGFLVQDDGSLILLTGSTTDALLLD